MTGVKHQRRVVVKSLALISCALLFALCSSADAQQAKKVPRIGYLASASPSSSAGRREAFREALRDRGYIESRNIAVEHRYAGGVAEYANLARELVSLKVDVIVVGSTPGAQAAKNATTTIPIVFTGVGDPIGTGVVASLAHPGANVTGFSNLTPELAGKQMELLKEAFPKISHLAVLWDPTNTFNTLALGETKIAAGAWRVTLQPLEVRSADDVEPAFSAIKRERASAVIVLRNPLTIRYRPRIVGPCV